MELTVEKNRLLDTIVRSIAVNTQVAKQYESTAVLERLRKEIPSHIYIDAKDQTEILGNSAEWFKEDYMTWVGEPVPCSNCGKDMEVKVDYFDDWRLRKLEHNTCNCGNTFEFPRFGDLLEIAKTRKGLCGEYAFLYTGFVNSMGVKARFVHDFTDHAWTEALMNGEWTHVDSTVDKSNQVDFPMLYEGRWGKKLHYIFAYNSDGTVEDVTRKYTERWPEVKTRRIVDPIPEQLIALNNLRVKVSKH